MQNLILIYIEKDFVIYKFLIYIDYYSIQLIIKNYLISNNNKKIIYINLTYYI